MSNSSNIDTSNTASEIDTIISILEKKTECYEPYEWVNGVINYDLLKYDLDHRQTLLISDACTKVFNDRNSNLYINFTAVGVAPFRLNYSNDENAWKEFLNKVIDTNDFTIIGWSLRLFRSDEFEYLWYPYVDILLDIPKNVKIIVELNNKNITNPVLGSAIRIMFNTPNRYENTCNLIRTIWNQTLKQLSPDSKQYELITRLLPVLTPKIFIPDINTEMQVRSLIIETTCNNFHDQSRRGMSTKFYCMATKLPFQEIISLLD